MRNVCHKICKIQVVIIDPASAPLISVYSGLEKYTGQQFVYTNDLRDVWIYVSCPAHPHLTRPTRL